MARILLIMPYFQALGGTERVVVRLASSLAAKHDVHVCALSAENTIDVSAFPFALHIPPAHRSLPIALRWLTYCKEARWLRSLKRAVGADITISNLWRADLINVLSGTSEPKVAVLHTSVTGRANQLIRRFQWLAARIYRRFTLVVAVSPGLLEEARRFNRVSRDRVRFIANSVEVPATPSVKKTYDVVWCGRFVEEKNPIGAVAVFRNLLLIHPRLRIAMIGDGPLHGAAIDAAGQLAGKAVQPGRIAFLGALQTAWPEIGKSRLLVLTSVTEGLPLVMLEAMTQGVPVVSADSGGRGPHLLVGGTSAHDPHRPTSEMTAAGVLLPIPVAGTSSINLWADTLANLLSNGQAVARFGQGASERARRYSPEATQKEWEKLIQKVLA